jgi:SAM-dependent methyltransferase
MMARILNYAASHQGFAAQANLWFNPPILVGYEAQKVGLRWVNERVVEVPYTFRALSRVPADAKVLDVGATESTVCLSLATLGYDVTAIDPRPNPLSHERLQTVVGEIEEWTPETKFDAVVCLSTIEHLGTGEYGVHTADQRADLKAMQRMHELTKPGGVLVLTTSVGPASITESHRTYDQQGLDELLADWNVDDVTLVQRRGATSWVTIDERIASLAPDQETVAMVTATKSAG